MYCPNCKKEINPEWKICPFCDYKPKMCRNHNCQPRWLPQEARFCPECGVALDSGEGVSFPQSSIRRANEISVGDILCTDNTTIPVSHWPIAGKTAMGVVFYVDETAQHGWAVNLRDQGNFCWTSEGEEATVAELCLFRNSKDAVSDIDGCSNTTNIRTACSESSYPAAFAVDFPHNWYLPACGQLKMLIDEFELINESLKVVGGEELDLLYWSSTQCSQTLVWTVFVTGSVYGSLKDLKHKVRSIRSF